MPGAGPPAYSTQPTDAQCLSMTSGLRAHLQRRHVHDKQAQDTRPAAVLLESTTHTDDTDRHWQAVA